MRRGIHFAAVLILTPFALAAAAPPATRPAVTPMSEVELLRAENARLRAELERLRAATRPAVSAATKPAAASDAVTVQQLIATIPPAILFPDKSGTPGGENELTQQRLQDWATKNLVGRRVRTVVPFESNGSVKDRAIDIVYGDPEVAFGKYRLTTRTRVVNERDATLPASQSDAVLRLKRKDPLTIAGTVESVRFSNIAATVVLSDAHLSIGR